MKTKTFFVFLRTFSIIFLISIFYSGLSAQQSVEELKNKNGEGTEVQYLLYLPQGYQADGAAWPMILFLHGSGERGTDIEIVKKNGPPKLIAEGKQFPFIIVSPQCPEGMRWSVDTLNDLLNSVVAKYNVDTNRIYLTGLSMGGYGTYALAMAYPHRFAAIAPVCGEGDLTRAEVLKDTPIWVFHGEKDNVVPIETDILMVQILRNMGNPVKFTTYPNVGHDAWTPAYNNPKLYKWFLKHKRKPVK